MFISMHGIFIDTNRESQIGHESNVMIRAAAAFDKAPQPPWNEANLLGRQVGRV